MDGHTDAYAQHAEAAADAVVTALPALPASPAYDVVFAHPSVRLVKTVTGSTEATALQSLHGPMQLVAVTPSAPMLPTLVLSMPGFTLPFRTFNPDSVGTSGIHDAEPPRPTYACSSEQGVDGAAIWFKEHITEEGAWARKSLQQPAAIWTLTLDGATQALAVHLQSILSGWPRQMPSELPEELSDQTLYGWPWKAHFTQLPLPVSDASPDAITSTPRPLPTPRADTAAAQSAPAIPVKPTELRADANSLVSDQPLTPPAEETRELPNLAPASSATPTAVNAAAKASPSPSTKKTPPRPVSSSGRGVPRSNAGDEPPVRKIELLPSLPPSTILPNIEHNAWAEPEEKSNHGLPAEYRHSLVAVDNDTGEVLGILASNVILQGEQDPDTTIQPNDSDEQDGPTPTTSRLQVAKVLPPKSAQEGPLRPFTAYRDPDVFSPYAPSKDPDRIERPPSRLGEETFSPPPVPDKGVVSARDSMASAVFFSAAEELESGAEDTDAGPLDTDDESARVNGTKGRRHDGFQLGSDRALHAVETYKAGLLRDAGDEDDDGADSDRSGSTVGGILTRAFRKKRKAAKRKEDHSTQNDATATSPITDVETSEVLASIGPAQDADVDQEPTDQLSVLRSRDPNLFPQHLPRTQLRTSALLDAEHRVWTEALEQDEIPATAPYTHLAAVVAKRPTSVSADDGWTGSGAAREAQTTEAAYVDPDKSASAATRAAAMAAAAGEYIQGGTVLLKFLQGTITASMVSPTQLARYVGANSASAQGSNTSEVAAQGEASKASQGESAEELRTGAMRYIPVLPVHLLYYMGIVTDKPAPSETDLPSAAKGALDSVARAAGVGFGVGRLWKTLVESAVGQQGLVATASNPSAALAAIAPSHLSFDMLGMTKSGAATCWSWMTTAASATTGALQSVVEAAVATTSSTSKPWLRSSQHDIEEEENDADDDEWEVRIPDFDPNSLASTPRPIYRRKVKSVVPSAANGFGLAGQSQVRSSPLSTPRPDTAQAAQPLTERTSTIDWKRTSIVHFDAHGVGRRAIVASGPGPLTSGGGFGFL